MSEAEYMGVTPIQESDQNKEESCVKQALELGCGSACSKALEQKREDTQSEQEEMRSSEPSIVDEEELQLCSEESKNSQTGKKSFDEPTTLLQGSEFVLESVSCEPSERVLRSRSQEKPKPPESSNNLVDGSIKTEREKKKQRVRNAKLDEFIRIRQRLRYLQNKINYEQSLIDAYSGEGWKGLSLEKLKPEKELQRATSEILRQKLKIRDLFQYLDSLCVEGRIPESLFDSKGEILSEDIFCAKCGSKDVSLDNDIILCDGACARAFHQFCLEPPLHKEDIPPGDEGWLCPGCDCKLDCIDSLNKSHGANLILIDNWEKVFPEAAVTAGKNQDHNFGLPSDDSADDDDYAPDVSESDEKVQEDATSSDESQYTAPSDDYDPSDIDHDDKVKPESSSSDSMSEDLGTALDENTASGKVGRKKPQSVNEELSSLLESNLGEEGSEPVSEKRRVERLDYKKLHDEAYGSVPTDSSEDEIWTAKETLENVSSDSSDDEYMTNTTAPRKRKNTTRQVSQETDLVSKKRKCQKRKAKDTNGSSSNRRLGEAATRGLYEVFKNNQYPDRATKERLAAELGLTLQQVDKWFGNARWSSRHSTACPDTH